MYRILMRQGWDGEETLVHADVGNGPRLMTAKLSKSVTTYDTLTVTAPPTNALYGNVNPLQTFLRVVRVDKRRVLFDGRVWTYQPAMASDGTLTNEVVAMGLEDFLHDSIQPFAEYHDISPAQFLAALLAEHNKQVEPYKQIKLGNINVTNSTDNVYRFTDDGTDTYDTIQDKLVKRLGGELRVRRENDGLYLDYLTEIGEQSNQIIRLATNMMSLTQKLDPTSVITVIKPLGKAAERTTTSETEISTTQTSTPRLTIESVNNGSPFLRDEALIKQFGVITVSQKWDDVTDPTNLKAKAQAVLAAQQPVKEQLQITAADLSMVHGAVDDYVCGNYNRIINPLLGYDANRRIVSQELDFCQLQSSSMKAGDVMLTQEEYTRQITVAAELAKAQAAISEARLSDLKSQITNVGTELDAIKKEIAAGSSSYYEGSIIDVSEFQKSIDWTKVVNAGLALAVIRVQHGTNHEDLTYKTNIPAAISAGANYGVYAYFNGLSVSDSEVEATNFYNRTQAVIGTSRQPRLYMIDVEENTVTSGTLAASVTAYLNKLNSLGVPDSKIVIYVSNALHNSIDTTRTQIWIPSYGDNDGTVINSTKPLHAYDLWQYTSQGHVAGITANTVDMSTEPSARFKSAFLTK